LAGRFVDGREDGSRIDKLARGVGRAACEFVVVDGTGAWWNEEFRDWDAEGVGDPLDDIDADVADAALDSGNRGTRNSGSLCEGFLRELGSGSPKNDVGTKGL
jgi:hypothetical protein